MKNKMLKKLQVALCLVLCCTTLSACVFNEPLYEMGKSLGSSMGDSDDRDDESAMAYVPESSEVIESTQPVEEQVPVSNNMDAQTIMVYMVGSDLESEYGNATIDMEEMMASDINTNYNNVVVYTGGASQWQTAGISEDENTILLLNEKGEFIVEETTASKNMGEADTLSGFINYCFENYPAQNYGLVLWNHGAGPVYGFGVDENYQDLLSVAEMKKAFDDSVGANQQRLEWVGFDACLMNSLEIADMLTPYANYMIASQETEPGWGWDYDFLSDVSDRAMTGAEVGKEIVDSYMKYSHNIFDDFPRYYCDLTLSCIDLSKYQAVEDSLNKCFGELDAGLTVENYPELVRNREHTRDFGTYASTFDYGMVDAIHLLNQIAPDSSAAMEAVNAIDEMVVYSQSNMDNANGVSICYPSASGTLYTDACIAIQEEIDFSSEYRGFLDKYYSIQDGDQLVSDWNLSESETSVVTVEAETEDDVDTSDISLQLSAEQQANYAVADFFILANVKGAGYDFPEDDPRIDDMYMFIHCGKDVKLDENGVLHGYYGNEVLYVHDTTEDVYSNIPMILIESDRTEQEVRYTCGAVLNNWNIAEIEDWKTEAATLQIVVNDEYPNGIIRSAVPLADEEETNPSKQLLDLDDFGLMEIFARASYVTRGENGEMLNFYEWEESGWMLGFDQDLTHDYELEMRPLEDPENYVCMFRIKDAQGNVSYSELIPLG